MNLGIHNHGPKHRWEKIDMIAAAIKDHSPRIGCCVDTGHFLRSREDPVRAVEVFGPRCLRRPPQGRQGCHGLHDPGRGRPADQPTCSRPWPGSTTSYGLNLEYEENPKDPLDDIRACLKAAQTAAREA